LAAVALAAAVCWCRVAAPFDPPNRPRNLPNHRKLLAKLLQPKKGGENGKEQEKVSQ